MRKIYVCFILICMNLLSHAYAQGIAFEHTSFAAVKAKAKAEKKMIFLDFYTAWCGPCKRMAETTFKKDSVGVFFNEHFINLKIDAEKGEGRQLAANYRVALFPTFLFLDEEGNLYKKGIAYQTDTAFLLLAHSAVKEFTTPDNLTKMVIAYPKKKNDTIFLRTYIDKLVKNNQPATAAIEQYLTVQRNMQQGSKSMLDFLTKYWTQLTLGGKADAILQRNDSVFKKIADSAQLVLLKGTKPTFFYRTQQYAAETKNPALLKIYIQTRNNRPPAERALFNEQGTWLDFYQASAQWELYRKYANKWLDSIAGTIQPLPDSINNLNPFRYAPPPEITARRQAAAVVSNNAKTYYLQFPNEDGVLDKVKNWMKASLVINTNNASALSFYANLLYTAGDTTAALATKERALKYYPKVSLHRDIAQANLVRMQHGEMLEEE